MAPERLEKVLAEAGIASRRGAKDLVREGRVTVNGRVAESPGQPVDPGGDHIRVDGKLLHRASEPRRYFVAYKPRQMVTTLDDPEGRPTVAELIRAARIRERVYPVGRLDWDADGLLLLTNDGDLAQRVAHPRSHLPKSYRVKVKGRPDEEALERLRTGVTLERGGRTLPARVRIEQSQGETTWLRIELVEGRQNQLKRMLLRVGHPVRRLRRMSIGPLRLGRMRPREVRPLRDDELARLRRALDENEPSPPARGPDRGRGRRGAARSSKV
jgi:23S rRNA pseudouridine2605 synthase